MKLHESIGKLNQVIEDNKPCFHKYEVSGDLVEKVYKDKIEKEKRVIFWIVFILLYSISVYTYVHYGQVELFTAAMEIIVTIFPLLIIHAFSTIVAESIIRKKRGLTLEAIRNLDGYMFANDWYTKNIEKIRDQLSSVITEITSDIEYDYNKLDTERRQLTKERADFNEILKQKKTGFPWLATAIADYYSMFDKKLASALRKKKRPAKRAADSVRAITKEKKILMAKLKVKEYTIDYYESLFPWLADYRDDSIDDQYVEATARDTDKNEDRAKLYISSAEYERLSIVEKFQLALDRYNSSRKNNWEIGREYERYIGYTYEQKGYDVDYYGAKKGLEDLGRDLVVKKNGTTTIIQCKYWSKEKTIHEKHIYQLFGTKIDYEIDYPNTIVECSFVTSTSLSDRAKEAAEKLGICVQEKVPYKAYPKIKCNISMRDDEKIFHLPFDQQYDNVKIDREGECYVKSVQEAIDLGFRRAYRWHGMDENSVYSNVP